MSVKDPSLPPIQDRASAPDGVEWHAHADARFEIRQYDRAAPFASFLPGIAGSHGAPLWCMYVNRGQAVCSFGVESKDQSIAEFFSATAAYRLTGLYGFRTFLCEADGTFHEPFAGHSPQGGEGRRRLIIEPHSVSVVDENEMAGWKVEVSYCVIPGSVTPALSRSVRITNLWRTERRVRVADGLPVIVPAGVSDLALKKLRRITEGFVRARPHPSGAATFALPASMQDSAEVYEIDAASFFGCWKVSGNRLDPLPIVVDPDVLFRTGSDLILPEAFVAGNVDMSQQKWMNRLPCAFGLAQVDIAPGQTTEFVVYTGLARHPHLLQDFLETHCEPAVQRRIEPQCRAIVNELTLPAFASTALTNLNGYLRQNYLDNLLRGGVPFLFPSLDGPRPVHLYARRHGDMERDYNEFLVPAQPFSEGPGNYRDILQNRRHDGWFYPVIGRLEVKAFLELIQPDGYNPLAVEGYRWCLEDKESAASFCPSTNPEHRQTLTRLITRPFSPGALLLWLADHDIDCETPEEWISNLLSHCSVKLTATGDDHGYWCDHWTYLTDMIEAWRALYPRDLEGLLGEKIGWYEPAFRVLPEGPRRRNRSGRLRLYGALQKRSAEERSEPWPEVTVAAKLLLLAALKAMTLDPEGRGIELEAGRPCWNDAMNGLPGLFGSSTCETAELARLARLLRDLAVDSIPMELPAPAADLVHGAAELLRSSTYDWPEARRLREAYREAAYFSLGVSSRTVDAAAARALLDGIESACMRGIEASRIDGSPLIHTYFRRDGEIPAGIDDLESLDRRFIVPEPLPLFLEGQIHLLRLTSDAGEAQCIYRAIKESPLYDRKLGMVVLNENLENCTQEIGRARTFTRGIYENESVWLHMSYKLLVELLRHGLHDEFVEEAQTMLVPFMPPSRYGRSIFENSSYIVSSYCPEVDAHGRGYVARLSGSTAEFIHIWNLLTVGYEPFKESAHGLEFRLSPVLPGDWFSTEPTFINWADGMEAIPANALAFTLFGTILCVCHNEQLKNTWGADRASVKRYVIDGESFNSDAVRGEAARLIRDRRVKRIDVWLE